MELLPRTPARKRLGTAPSFLASVLVHGSLAGLFLWTVSSPAGPLQHQIPDDARRLVYVAPASGGGGRLAEAPARRTEVPAHVLPQPIPLVAPPPSPPPPLPVLDVSFDTPAATVLRIGGTALTSLGDVGGIGRGPGAGDGAGDGIGPGRDGGDGGGPRQVGGDVTAPILVREVQPSYTPEAMRARIRGEVHIRAVIRADGTVGEMTIIKSLDRAYGLDQAALAAARQWRFLPSRAAGRPVDVVVTLILEFRLH